MLIQNIKAKLILPLLLVCSLSACKKEDLSGSTNFEVQPLTIAREICFTALAGVSGCIGENIILGGLVELVESTTVDQNGHVHYTRHWTVRGLTGRGVLPGGTINTGSTLCPRPYTGQTTSNVYDIVAGQEMFSVKDPNTTTGVPNAVLSGEIFIHQGTIVFVNRATGERIVVRHEIIKTPGQGILRSAWYIRGQKC